MIAWDAWMRQPVLGQGHMKLCHGACFLDSAPSAKGARRRDDHRSLWTLRSGYPFKIEDMIEREYVFHVSRCDFKTLPVAITCCNPLCILFSLSSIDSARPPCCCPEESGGNAAKHTWAYWKPMSLGSCDKSTWNLPFGRVLKVFSA